MVRYKFFIGAVAALCAAGALAQERAAPQQRPEAFEALIRCRAITNDAARLQCFDNASTALEQAAERRDLVVVDRQQVRESRRRLFGLPIPGLGNLFGGGGDNDRDEITSIDSTVASAEQTGMGRWIVRLADGSIWVQTDDVPLAGRPRAGQPVHVERGALGSYRMRVNRQPAVRVRRQL
jgi:hypothetical protein